MVRRGRSCFGVVIEFGIDIIAAKSPGKSLEQGLTYSLTLKNAKM